jgi:hypothetical protein
MHRRIIFSAAPTEVEAVSEAYERLAFNDHRVVGILSTAPASSLATCERGFAVEALAEPLCDCGKGSMCPMHRENVLYALAAALDPTLVTDLALAAAVRSIYPETTDSPSAERTPFQWA